MAPESRVRWRYHRIVNPDRPHDEPFDDIAGPADWELLATATGRTDAELAPGGIESVDPGRRVGGSGAAYVMAPFVHASPDRPGRFHDGTHGAFYAANRFDTALLETVFHLGGFLAATGQEPGWIVDLQELVGVIDAALVDIRGGGYGDLLDPDSYAASQEFARGVRFRGGDGIVYPSVRHAVGECFAAFHPDVMEVPIPERVLACQWDGNAISNIREVADGGDVFEIRD